MTSTKLYQHTIEDLSQAWRDEHDKLHAFFEDYRQWSYQVAQRGIPHFGETACRLKHLRAELEQHFSCEDEICQKLMVCKGGMSPELDAMRRQTAIDHESLLTRLDQLIDQLGAVNPLFDSWQQAVSEVERFCDALEVHEEQEADCITWLLPDHA